MQVEIDWNEIATLAESPDNWAVYGKNKIKATYEKLGLSGVNFRGNCGKCYKDAFILIVLEGRQRGEIPAVADLQANKKYTMPAGGIRVLGRVFNKYSTDEDIEFLLNKIPSFKRIIKIREQPANIEIEKEK